MRNILIGVVGIAAAFVGFVAMQPGELRVERSALVHAPAEVVFDQLDDFEAWHTWNPWSEMDPNMKREITGPQSGVGAGYTWTGNDEVGKGSMEILEIDPAKRVKYDLKFIEPFEDQSYTTITLAPEADGTKVTWLMTSDNGFMDKLVGLAMDMDGMIGGDFERGLAKLDVVSKKAVDRIAKEKAAAEALAKAAEAAKAEGEATKPE